MEIIEDNGETHAFVVVPCTCTDENDAARVVAVVVTGATIQGALDAVRNRVRDGADVSLWGEAAIEAGSRVEECDPDAFYYTYRALPDDRASSTALVTVHAHEAMACADAAMAIGVAWEVGKSHDPLAIDGAARRVPTPVVVATPYVSNAFRVTRYP